MCGPGLERLHIGVDGAAKRETGQIREMIGADGRSEALLSVAAEVRPRRSAGVCLQHEVPLLCDTGEMVGGQPHFVLLASHLSAEELLTLVEPS